MNWQPIETAPKDGTRILVYQRGRQRWVCAVWDDNRYSRKPSPYWRPDDERSYGILASRNDQPTTWMPLPSPPSVEDGE